MGRITSFSQLNNHLSHLEGRITTKQPPLQTGKQSLGPFTLNNNQMISVIPEPFYTFLVQIHVFLLPLAWYPLRGEIISTPVQSLPHKCFDVSPACSQSIIHSNGCASGRKVRPGNPLYTQYLLAYKNFVRPNWDANGREKGMTVQDISRDDRARTAACRLRTTTDRFKENYNIVPCLQGVGGAQPSPAITSPSRHEPSLASPRAACDSQSVTWWDTETCTNSFPQLYLAMYSYITTKCSFF